MILGAICTQTGARAESGESFVRQGNTLYYEATRGKEIDEDKLKDAIEAYKEALRRDPTPLVKYNLGTAQARLKAYQDARQTLSEAAEAPDGVVKQNSNFNLGIVTAKPVIDQLDSKSRMTPQQMEKNLKTLEDTLKSFRSVIVEAPNDNEAVYNYEVTKNAYNKLKKMIKNQPGKIARMNKIKTPRGVRALSKTNRTSKASRASSRTNKASRASSRTNKASRASSRTNKASRASSRTSKASRASSRTSKASRASSRTNKASRASSRTNKASRASSRTSKVSRASNRTNKASRASSRTNKANKVSNRTSKASRASNRTSKANKASNRTSKNGIQTRAVGMRKATRPASRKHRRTILRPRRHGAVTTAGRRGSALAAGLRNSGDRKPPGHPAGRKKPIRKSSRRWGARAAAPPSRSRPSR